MNLAIIGLRHIIGYQIAAIVRIENIRFIDAMSINPVRRKTLPGTTRFQIPLAKLARSIMVDLFLVSAPNALASAELDAVERSHQWLDFPKTLNAIRVVSGSFPRSRE